MKKLIFFLIIFPLILLGCNIGGQAEDVKPLFIGANKIVDQSKSDEAKQIVLSMDEVIEVKGVNTDKDIYVAVKVKQFDRLFLDPIRNNAHNKVKKRFPNANVHISTDKKVFLELEKLENEVHQNKINKQNFQKRIKKIEDFMTG